MSWFTERKSSSSKKETVIDLDQYVELAEKFLRHPHDSLDEPCYKKQLCEIAQGERTTLEIKLDHLFHFGGDSESLFLDKVVKNSLRFMKVFETATDFLYKEIVEIYGEAEDVDGISVLNEHRKLQQERLKEESGIENDSEQLIPVELTRKFELVFLPLTKEQPQELRQIKASQVGRYVSLRGIVTRVGEVLPRMVVACYMCENCGHEIYQPVNTRDFTPLTDCITKKCKYSKKKGIGCLYLRPKYSRFVKYQELRVQELPEQVPVGNVPRSVTVEARGECTRKCTAGDVILLSGIFLPEKPRMSFAKGASANTLVFSTYIRSMEIKKEKKGALTEGFTALQMDELIREEERSGRSIYDRLAKSIAPEIWGHDDVKKAILLQLAGGVAKSTHDGMKIRGDINIALFGDPGVAKSQILKHVCTFAPRAVYTTGKGSSGVGLTAAITKDSFSGEVALEGGALVLADKGICCIDEFDKMDEADRTAIHEVMEQQTVSIAKAGITTTLNARTAILAAANPLYGRYNKKLSPTQNINLPAALLSRFDLLFLLLDKVGLERDRALAEHITYVHMHNKHPTLEHEVFPMAFLRSYISRCQAINPVIPDFESENLEERERGRRLLSHIVEAYVEMRKQDAMDTDNNHAKSALTPRQLLSILRLASSHARIRNSKDIAEEDVDEAIRLVRASKSSIEDDENVVSERDDPISKIFRIVSDMLKGKSADEELDASLNYSAVEERVLRMGFTRDQLRKTLDEYSRDDVGVLHINSSRTSIRFVDV